MYLRREQEADGSWFGRWGTNYIYGTWSVLCALNAVGEDMAQPYVRKAVEWLKSRQQAGWRLGRELRQLLGGAQGRGVSRARPRRRPGRCSA